MRVQGAFAVLLLTMPIAVSAQQPVVATAKVSDDTSFHELRAARFWTHLDASLGWQPGTTSFAFVHGDYCPVLATLDPEAPLYLIGGIDSLQVDDTPLPRGAVPDSVITSADRHWHALDLKAVKARFKGC
jgi:hypothetical protein